MSACGKPEELAGIARGDLGDLIRRQTQQLRGLGANLREIGGRIFLTTDGLRGEVGGIGLQHQPGEALRLERLADLLGLGG